MWAFLFLHHWRAGYINRRVLVPLTSKSGSASANFPALFPAALKRHWSIARLVIEILFLDLIYFNFGDACRVLFSLGCHSPFPAISTRPRVVVKPCPRHREAFYPRGFMHNIMPRLFGDPSGASHQHKRLRYLKHTCATREQTTFQMIFRQKKSNQKYNVNH